MDVYTLGLLFLGIATTAGSINFIVTALKLRAPGMSLNRVPLFVWAIVATAFMVIFALPALNLDNAMLFLDRRFDTRFFDPDAAGNVLLWQHLFWIFGHPDVYIIVMPALGIVSAVLPAFTRRGVVGYVLVVLAIVSISIISFGVWVHHMFATGLPQLSYSFFSAASTIITIPSGIQIFAWLATMALGRVVVKVPLLFLVGFIVTFVLGGFTGTMFALTAFDQQVTDSYFVVAHFHYVLIGGAVFPILAGIYYWLPKITGRMYHEGLGRWAFWLFFTGMQVTFFPMHLYGLFGMPRRVYTYRSEPGWDVWNLVSTVGAYILAAGLLLVLVGVLHAVRRGRPAPPDPWGGDTLEWSTDSPPKPYNFPSCPRCTACTPPGTSRAGRPWPRAPPPTAPSPTGGPRCSPANSTGVANAPCGCPSRPCNPSCSPWPCWSSSPRCCSPGTPSPGRRRSRWPSSSPCGSGHRASPRRNWGWPDEGARRPARCRGRCGRAGMSAHDLAAATSTEALTTELPAGRSTGWWGWSCSSPPRRRCSPACSAATSTCASSTVASGRPAASNNPGCCVRS